MNEQLIPHETKKFILLDRDGVINFDSDDYIKHPNEWVPIPGSLEAIAAMNKAGIDVFVITNQSGVGRGLFNIDTLHAMHKKMETQLAAFGGRIEKIYFCPHIPQDKCACRKPNTGMLDSLEQEFKTSLRGVPLIGDSKKDLELAVQKSCLPILVKTGKGMTFFESEFKNFKDADRVLVFDDLNQAHNYLLTHYF